LFPTRFPTTSAFATPSPVWVQVPLDTAGEPMAPFAYHGVAKSAEEALRDLKPEQIAAVRAATAHVAFGGGEPAKSVARFHDLAERTEPGHSYHSKSSDIVIFALSHRLSRERRAGRY
jgi:hypothetical protein